MPSLEPEPGKAVLEQLGALGASIEEAYLYQFSGLSFAREISLKSE